MFGAKANANYDGLNIPSLPPAIYKNYELTDVKKDKTTPKDGGEGTAILTFTFDGEKGPVQHTEYDIKAGDEKAASKAENMVKRVGHILSRVGVSKEVLATNNNTTFDAYANWVMGVLGTSYKGIKVDIKIVGNVYQGKATSGFPGYIPFIEKSPSNISFSATEVSSNNAYFKTLNATPDIEGSGSASAAGAPPKGIDTDF